MDKSLWLEHEEEWHEDVHVCGLGVSARPLEDGFEVWGVFDFECGGVVEWCVVDGADGVACDFVAEGEEMGEVVFAEVGV